MSGKKKGFGRTSTRRSGNSVRRAGREGSKEDRELRIAMREAEKHGVSLRGGPDSRGRDRGGRGEDKQRRY
ncbi:MAG TPA: hypothetical protein VEW42_05445 [Candidatus Eisenbacteria bacterium]|nr:hypothetical protein [Candidatus Eisenbacteria bacterium]